MILDEKDIKLPRYSGNISVLEYFKQNIAKQLSPEEFPVRFVISRTDDEYHQCELGILTHNNEIDITQCNSIFDFKKRDFENIDEFNAVLLVPTGIGAEIGGHSGDAGPIARLLAAACDTLVVHPNVVNAADINEMSENTLYVEGSVITRFIMGVVGLQKVRSNRVLLIIDKHEDKLFHELAINSASAARAAFGLDCPQVLVMDDKVLMRSLYSDSGRAVGRIEYIELLCEILEQYRSEYDAIALSTLVEVPEHFHADYFRDELDMVNPWGGVEAMLTHTISLLFNVPSAHSPMMNSRAVMNLDVGVVDPRKAAEVTSTTNLHCILKGLHKSPRIIPNPTMQGHSSILTATDISCLIIPDGCVGLPTLAAIEQGIPVIAVRENRNYMRNSLEELPFAPGKLHLVENYLEAVGIMNAIKAGVAPETVRRPLRRTIIQEPQKNLVKQHPLLDDV